ncbi:hypothetical protein ACFLTL_01135 [Chloroflexota bacterium]
MVNYSTGKAKNDWLKSFMLIYYQAIPLIDTTLKMDTEAEPPYLESMIEAYHLLPPMLQAIKKMHKPSDKELSKIKVDFERTLRTSIKAGEMALKAVDDYSHGAQTATRMRFAAIIGLVNLTKTNHESLLQRLAKIGVL